MDAPTHFSTHDFFSLPSPSRGTTQFPHPSPLADNPKPCLRHYSLYLCSHAFRRRDLGFVASEIFRRSQLPCEFESPCLLKCVFAEMQHLPLLCLYLHYNRRLTNKPRVSETTVDFLFPGKHQCRLQCNCRLVYSYYVNDSC